MGPLAAACALLATGPALPVAGQLVDRGTFRILAEGREVGTEDFTIHRRGAGDARTIFARGRISMRDGRELETTLLMVGPDPVLVEYVANQTGADPASVELARAGEHFRALTTDQWGERMRSYRARPATFVLDEGVAHHYFVLGRFVAADSLQRTVHAYRRGAEELEPLEVLGTAQENIERGGEQVEVTRVSFRTRDGAGAAWFDGSRRLVRVALPGGAVVAEIVP